MLTDSSEVVHLNCKAAQVSRRKNDTQVILRVDLARQGVKQDSPDNGKTNGDDKRKQQRQSRIQ
jgi:hypothetical protein